MKILLIGDLHLRSLSDHPKYRLDNHYEQQFKELSEIRDIAATNKVDMMISLGDFFDNTRVSFSLVNDVVAWCKTLPCSLFSLIGNHDINAYVTSDKNNGLGVLMEAQAIERLDEVVFEKEKVVIRGIHAYLDPKNGDYFFDEVKYKDYYKIVCSHNFCIPHEVPFDAVLPSQIKTNAQVLVFGHYHKAFSHFEGTTAFVNPGSISRWAINEQWQPQVFILDTVTGIITPVQLKSSLPANEIFDLASAAELKSTEMNLQNFVDSLENTQFENIDLLDVVRKAGKDQNIAEPILTLALEKIEKAKEELQ
jgi:DNA repair exonuclease SbcCD nuclease subunit